MVRAVAARAMGQAQRRVATFERQGQGAGQTLTPASDHGDFRRGEQALKRVLVLRRDALFT